HQFDHFRDVPGGARLHRGRQAAQGVVGLSESAVVAFADLPPLHAFGRGDVENLVVDVGDVAAEDDPVAAVHQPAAEDVEADARADVPDVRGSLHGGTTQVQRDTSLTQRDEVTDLTGSGVVEAQTHGVKVSRFPTVSAIALVFPCGIRGNADCRTVPQGCTAPSVRSAAAPRDCRDPGRAPGVGLRRSVFRSHAGTQFADWSGLRDACHGRGGRGRHSCTPASDPRPGPAVPAFPACGRLVCAGNSAVACDSGHGPVLPFSARSLVRAAHPGLACRTMAAQSSRSSRTPRRPAPPATGTSSRVAVIAMAVLCVTAIAACAILLSYNGIFQIALRGGVTGWAAHLYPGMFILLLLMAFWAIYLLRDAPRRRRIWVDLLVLAMILAAAGASALHSLHYELVEWAATLVVAGGPWLALLISFRLLLWIVAQVR